MKFTIKKYWYIILLLIVAVITVIINQFPAFIEQYYATGLYPYISRAARLLLGWVPFSVGDILYGVALIWLIIRMLNFVKRWRRKQLNRHFVFYYARRTLQAVLVIYIAFNWLWGFNYNRLGSAYQMSLKFERYSNEQLVRLSDTIVARLNALANDTASMKIFDKPKQLGIVSTEGYKQAATAFPFLDYKNVSVKAEMLYKGGNYLGFLGYLNPFTNEAQLNTTIPKVLLPYVSCHEMAHQLGYASESEANFIGYLACKQSAEPAFKYSVYIDIFAYTIGDLYYRDSATAQNILEVLPVRIKKDRKEIRTFFNSYKNPFSPIINWLYDKYLKMNSQPKGKESYNEVVGWLIAYALKYGWDKI